KVIYGLPCMDDGKFNQIVTPNHRLPGVGEKCEGVCDRCARCHRGDLSVPRGASENNGECIQAGNDAQFR
ncbi:hypothetical protein AAVH_36479, partial [Aphelenchoides avenae]